MKIGLFFGSFNPIHVGHLIIANHFIEFTDIEQVWFVVSPQNPFKEKGELMDETDRLNMVKLSIANNPSFHICDIEFSLPKPSYTINTLAELQKQYPEHTFILLMGADNLQHINKWKDYEKIVKSYDVYVYQRRGAELSLLDQPYAQLFTFPFLDVSSTYIRECLQDGKSVKYLVPEEAIAYMRQKGL